MPSKVDGIQVYRPIGPEEIPHKEVVEFKCPQCGATTAYSAADGGLTCIHCGYSETSKKAFVGKGAAQFEFTVETMQRAEQGWGEERMDLECKSCGAVTSIPGGSLTHTCPFCGSNQVIQRQPPQDILRPRSLIPFQLQASDCTPIAREWLGSSWMTPASLGKIASLSTFTGIYLPYWSFDSVTSATWKAEVGHTRTERYHQDGEWKERTVIDWRWESGDVRIKIDDLLIPGTSRVSNRLLTTINTFDINALAEYEPNFLAGLQAQTYDVPLEQAWESGRQQMREQTRQACLEQASTSQIRNFSMNLDFSDESWRYLLLPVYLTTYRYAGKVYQVIINGQNGTIAGQRPVDWAKIWVVIGLLVTPGILLGLIGLVTIPLAGIGIGIGLVGLLLLIIAVVVGLIILNKANALDDA
jgi:predicted RNA-binding Zn-ribbon protein involved in translation (DUF1610 family)